MSEALQLCEIEIVLGDRPLLAGVSLRVAPGEVCHLQGPNGVGKSTLLKVIAGLRSPDSGDIFWGGESICAQRAVYADSLHYQGHALGFKDVLTPFENLFYGLRQTPSGSEVIAALQAVGVSTVAHRKMRQLSAGQRMRVALAQLHLSKARLWLLDEPFTALDRAGQELLASLIDNHVAAGGLVVLTAHQGLPGFNTETCVVALTPAGVLQ